MTRSERRVLAALADGYWHPETELRTTFAFLQGMYFRGMIDGAMLTFGGTPEDRIWRVGGNGHDTHTSAASVEDAT